MENAIDPKVNIRNIFLIVLITLVSPAIFYAQNYNEMHDETPDDDYVFVDRSTMERGPSYRVNGTDIFTRQTNVDIDGNDIIGDAGNEPSLAVDPTNPNRIVMGWRQFDDAANYFRQAGYAYSLDGGYNWVNPGVLRPGIFGTDPVLDFDANGNFYYNSFRPQPDWTCEVSSISLAFLIRLFLNRPNILNLDKRNKNLLKCLGLINIP